MTTEYALLERARLYDEQAIGELYDQYAARVYSYIYRRVQDAQLAEDLTSDVFIRVLEAIQSERFWHTSFRAWLYRIAHNLVVDYWRRQPAAAQLPLEDDVLGSETACFFLGGAIVEQEELQRAVLRLTPDQQQVLSLRFGEQLKAQEVAEIMGKNVNAVESLQHRALETLRRLLKDKDT